MDVKEPPVSITIFLSKTKVTPVVALKAKSSVFLQINSIAVFFYNATLLSYLYPFYLKAEPDKANKISRLSPMAWRTSALLGNVNFTIEKFPLIFSRLSII